MSKVRFIVLSLALFLLSLIGFSLSQDVNIYYYNWIDLICAVLVVPIIFASNVSEWLGIFLIGLAAAAHQGWSANLYKVCSDMFPIFNLLVPGLEPINLRGIKSE